MKPFGWRIAICTIPLLVAAVVVATAFRNYVAGKGGFKLGVDLVGGTILVYEVDLDRFPNGVLPNDWNGQELAKRLKSRIDPNDLKNITIRSTNANGTRFEIILPTGGQFQKEADEVAWNELLKRAEGKFPVGQYITPPGDLKDLETLVKAQYPAPDQADAIHKFLAELYKDPADAPIGDVNALEELIKAEYKGNASANDIKDFIKDANESLMKGDSKNQAAWAEVVARAKAKFPPSADLWKEVLAKAREKYPPAGYVVPPGKTTELLADVKAQYPGEDHPAADVSKFIEDNYKVPADAKEPAIKLAWQNLLLQVTKQYPPKGYAVGRGRPDQLASDITALHPKVPTKEVTDFIEGNDDGAKGKKRKASLTQEEVQEAKGLISQVGSLEFRILASQEHDAAAIAAARSYFEKLSKDKDPAVQAELDRAAFSGKPPPPPLPADGGTTFPTSKPDGQYSYSWVEIGEVYRQECGLQNPRDPRTRALLTPAEIEADKLSFGVWKEIAKARAEGIAVFLRPSDPTTSPLIYSREVKNPRLPETERDKKYEYFLLTRDAEENKRITGDLLAGAAPGDNNSSVTFRMKPSGANLFYDFTRANKGQQMAIVLDGKIQSAANIKSPISTNGEISGNFTSDQINRLVKVLRSGALPATLKSEPVSESTMGPTLGADTIKWGATSVLLAFAAVLLFMLFYYRFAGLVACIALLANLLLTIAFMVLIDATFTLPGLAGLVLMLGMAVDANVLIYERLREERERGASLALAIRNGYDHALPTIIDTHLSSIFTAIVLYVVGNDQLKGFGISLTVGLIISLFTSLYMTRLLFDLCLARGWLTQLKMLQLFHRPNIDFMRIRYYWFTATIVLTVLGAGLFVYRMPDPSEPNKKSILNIDFVGGTAYGGVLTKMVDIEDLRAVLDKTHLPDQSVEQTFISSPEFSQGTKSKLFTLRTSEKNVKTVEDAINSVLAQSGSDAGQSIQLKRINLSKYEILPGGQEVTLTFTDPDSGQPAYASRAQVAMLLTRELNQQGLQGAAQSLSLEGMGPEEEGHFPWMKIVFVEPVKEKAKLEAALNATQTEFAARPQPERLEVFDSQLAAKTQLIALYAILASWAAILLYLWFRFGSWTFGAATVLCLIHDLFFTLGVIAACHYVSDTYFFHSILGVRDFKIDLPTVAALLTLVGYSVNDTIVVFDRIREVRGKNPLLTAKMINDSVNQTLSRTVLASLTVWVVVIVLYIWGGEGVHLFAFVMIIGVIVGTYSSIYIASPLLLIFGEGHAPGVSDRSRELQSAGRA